MTTMGLIKSSFETKNEEKNYKRILKLEQYGYIKRHITDGNILGWVLAKKGFQFIKPELVHLKSEGIQPANPHHDLFASAFHLGDWYKGSPPNVTLVSEQEISSLEKSGLPENVPCIQNHVPDGITIIHGDDKRVSIGFELEISQKTSYKYEVFASYYDAHDFKYIFWCVQNASMAQTIARVIESRVKSEVRKHNFILFDDLKNKLWKSEFFLGQLKGIAVMEALGRLGGGSMAARGRENEMAWLTCTKKSPRFLRGCKKKSENRIIDPLPPGK